jgi:hypothetical protein
MMSHRTIRFSDRRNGDICQSRNCQVSGESPCLCRTRPPLKHLGMGAQYEVGTSISHRATTFMVGVRGYAPPLRNALMPSHNQSVNLGSDGLHLRDCLIQILWMSGRADVHWAPWLQHQPYIALINSFRAHGNRAVACLRCSVEERAARSVGQNLTRSPLGSARFQLPSQARISFSSGN